MVNEYRNHPENPNFVVIKSWNEWAEGNYLEPDLKYGHEWLNAVKEVKNDFNNS
ncbi:MAG: glycoside hydrolase family 99-like domain-containing protein [Flavobacterium sp.]|uniref:glycoside hydrolase family 99-like domain-containing protein n=1 Tax=Flavobacterium sp. TaxID=239 RepID=UPI003265B991